MKRKKRLFLSAVLVIVAGLSAYILWSHRFHELYVVSTVSLSEGDDGPFYGRILYDSSEIRKVIRSLPNKDDEGVTEVLSMTVSSGGERILLYYSKGIKNHMACLVSHKYLIYDNDWEHVYVLTSEKAGEIFDVIIHADNYRTEKIDSIKYMELWEQVF